MSDLLYNAALEYQKYKNTIYNIVLGRKCKAYTLKLHFPPDSFYHLAGLQHLKDITFPSKNKERIYKEILKKKITIDTIRKSKFYDEWFIEERLNNFFIIEQMLDSNAVRYLLNKNQASSYTSIKADYLCERKIDIDTFFLFIVKEQRIPKFENECRSCCFIKKHECDYTNGASKTTTLVVEKIQGNDRFLIYKSPSYKD